MYSFPIILHKSYYVWLDCLSVWGASGRGSWRVHLKGSAGLHSGQLYTFWQPAVQETGAVTSIFVFLKTHIFLYVINELQSPKAQQCFHLCVQVCAFFDDATLANSLPNGKRKRGLNDNRKGLDQNIVGAIKGMGGENTRDLICLFCVKEDALIQQCGLCPVFTEKYCTEHRIEKLPGPRDWVQILQDQIKLARRRLKRGTAIAYCQVI